MRLTMFENFRKEKYQPSVHISVVTIDNTVESGWSNGRTLDELTEDFGKLGTDWFYDSCGAHAQVIKNRTIGKLYITCRL